MASVDGSFGMPVIIRGIVCYHMQFVVSSEVVFIIWDDWCVSYQQILHVIVWDGILSSGAWLII